MSLDGLATSIGAAIGATLQPKPAARVHGGSINECYRWESSAGPIFVKVAPARHRPMFDAESAGLDELRRAGAVRVPQVLGVGANAANAWLALEWISFHARSRASEAALGEKLALQHRRVGSAFGWERDNTIGSTPQPNGWLADWVTFVRERRLRFQLDLAVRNGHARRLQRRGEALLDRLDEFFTDYRPVPSLLHGDLWGGNWAPDEIGQPVVFDPAVYYGDREADLAMTRLFGGFGADFYAAYEATWEPDRGARKRVGLYNLYHLLNHANLFGGGYIAQAAAVMESLLAELRP
jgi:protein-ribulosamine 3-kinase